MIVLKILLGILLGILLLLFLIMLIRVEVLATYNDSLALTIKVLFFRIKILPSEEKPKKEKKKKPEKPKPKKEEKPKEEKEKKPSLIQRLREKKGLSGLLSLHLFFLDLSRKPAILENGLWSRTKPTAAAGIPSVYRILIHHSKRRYTHAYKRISEAGLCRG